MAKRLLGLGLWAGLGLTLASATGCSTTFTGSAYYPGGAQACFQNCQESNLEMASFVYVGEYSTACACKPRATSRPLASTQADIEESVIAAAAGVERQRQMQEQANASAARP